MDNLNQEVALGSFKGFKEVVPGTLTTIFITNLKEILKICEPEAIERFVRLLVKFSKNSLDSKLLNDFLLGRKKMLPFEAGSYIKSELEKLNSFKLRNFVRITVQFAQESPEEEIISALQEVKNGNI